MKVAQAYIDDIGDYKSLSAKSKLKYSLYFYQKKEQNQRKRAKNQNYLLLVMEIPGKIEELKAKYYKKEKIKGILIQGKKIQEDFPKQYEKIEDNRIFEDFKYFINLKNNIELSETESEEITDTHSFSFDTRNWEIGQEEDNVNEYKKDIASGIYSIKFKLTDSSTSKSA